MAAQPSGAPDPDALRPPLQHRSRASLERVLEAGQELLEEKGWDGFTVQEVSRRAKVSVGSIYARAPSKEALILAVYDRAIAALQEEQRLLRDEDTWEGLTLAEVVRRAVELTADLMLRHEPILRVVMNRAAVDPVIRERGAAQVRVLAEQWEELVLRHRGEIAHADPQLAVEMAFRLMFSTLARRVSLGSAFGAYRDLDDPQLAAELARAVSAYLISPAP